MTNIRTNTKNKDMQTHIDKAYKILDEFLPEIYVDKVLRKLPKDHTYSNAVIRNVRSNKNYKPEVLNALVEVALDNKKVLAKLKKLTT